MTLFRNQKKAGFGWGVAFVGNGIGLIVLVPAFAASIAAGSVATALILAANAALLRFYFRSHAYWQCLQALLQEKASDAKRV